MYQFKVLDGRYNPHPFSYCPVADFTDPDYVCTLYLRNLTILSNIGKSAWNTFTDYQKSTNGKAILNAIELLVVMHEPEFLFRRLDYKSVRDLYQKNWHTGTKIWDPYGLN